jgi:hypothetical protein
MEEKIEMLICVNNCMEGNKKNGNKKLKCYLSLFERIILIQILFWFNY